MRIMASSFDLERQLVRKDAQAGGNELFWTYAKVSSNYLTSLITP